MFDTRSPEEMMEELRNLMFEANDEIFDHNRENRLFNVNRFKYHEELSDLLEVDFREFCKKFEATIRDYVKGATS
jgi:hypothetical protein